MTSVQMLSSVLLIHQSADRRGVLPLIYEGPNAGLVLLRAVRRRRRLCRRARRRLQWNRRSRRT